MPSSSVGSTRPITAGRAGCAGGAATWASNSARRRWRRSSTLGPLIVGLAVMHSRITWPEVPVVPMLVVLGAGGDVLPIVLYPVVVHVVAGARHRDASGHGRRLRTARAARRDRRRPRLTRHRSRRDDPFACRMLVRTVVRQLHCVSFAGSRHTCTLSHPLRQSDPPCSAHSTAGPPSVPSKVRQPQ